MDSGLHTSPDFLAPFWGEGQELIQVCASLQSTETVARELKALMDGAREHPRARRLLLVLDRDAATEIDVPGVDVLPAYEWLLTERNRDTDSR